MARSMKKCFKGDNRGVPHLDAVPTSAFRDLLHFAHVLTS